MNSIHHYFGVDWDIVWNVIQNKIPEIKESLEKIN
ncbi:HepT-like ribonuclease domain-containing protein [Methanobacterium alkalithermotolerans]